jgi:hypothetical protein
MPALSKKGLMKLKGRTFSEEEYELLREALKASGFHNMNGAINTIADYIGYKAFLLYEEYEDDYGHKIFMEIIEEITPKGISYHIKEVTVE